MFMKIENIDKYFDNVILRRGYDYYKNGCVKSVKELDGIYRAVVDGTYKYHIVIDTNKERFDMSCSCPYDSYCKHMAAVLYYLKKDGKVSKDEKAEVHNIEFHNNKELVKCLNREYRDLKVKCHYDTLRYEELLELLKKIFKEVEKAENFHKFFDYCMEIHYWVDNHINEFYGSYDVDNYEDDYYDDDDEYCEYVSEIDEDEEAEEKVVIIEKKDIYDLILDSIMKCIRNDYSIFKIFLYYLDRKYLEDDDYCGYYGDYYEIAYLTRNVIDKKMAQELIKFVENIKIGDSFDDEILDDLIMKLRFSYYSSDEIIKYAKNNLKKQNVRKYLLNYYKENNYDEYINLLEQLIKMDVYTREKEEYIKILISFYKDNSKDDYERIIKLNYKMFPYLKNFILVKSLFSPSDWLKVRKDYMIPYKKYRDLYIDLCIEENEYDEVFKALDNVDLMFMDRYIDELKEIDSDRVSILLKNKIIEQAEHSYNGRKSYQELVEYLVKLYNLKKDENIVEEIINLFKEKYKNRKAMLEEIEFFVDTYLD